MIYLDQFSLPSHAEEDRLLYSQTCMSEKGYTDNAYPCNIFVQKHLSSLDFREVTILYGGNGSGKSTLLNLITKKLDLKRVSPFNGSNIFDAFTERCDYRMGYDDEGDFLRVPNGSRIITSDDVFDYMLNVRVNNKDIAAKVMATRKQHEELIYKKTVKMRGMQDYEDLRDQVIARKMSGRQYVYKENGKEVKLNSNGETALRFFYEKLKDDTLFLLDEPENSLSPKFQIELADMIKDMAKYSGCQFIIATHTKTNNKLCGGQKMIKENMKVRTLVEKEGFSAGTVGIVVSLYSNGPACEVELWDNENYPIDVVTYLFTELEEV